MDVTLQETLSSFHRCRLACPASSVLIAFMIGLFNATTLQLNEKGYFFTLLMYGLFSAVSVQKSVRDRLEGIPVTNIYYGLAWISLGISILLIGIGLWNAGLALSEKGFYSMAFLLSLFAAITVQKNTRDSIGVQAITSLPIE